MRIDQLNPDPENARTHGERNISTIVDSLTKFGQVEPLIVRRATRVVIGGNGRLAAMQQLGWTEADVVELDIDETRARALSLSLNRTAELAEWDFQRLGNIVRLLREQDESLIVGWTADELRPVLEAEWTPPVAPGEFASVDENLHTEARCPRCGYEWSGGSAAAGAGGTPYAATSDQRSVIDRAVAALREAEGDDAIPEGRCLELMAADYLSGRG